MEFNVDIGILLSNYKCFLNIQNAMIFGSEYLSSQATLFISLWNTSNSTKSQICIG